GAERDLWQERALGGIHGFLRFRHSRLRGGDVLIVGNRLADDAIELGRTKCGPPVAIYFCAQRNMLVGRWRRIAFGRIGLRDNSLGPHEIGTDGAGTHRQSERERQERRLVHSSTALRSPPGGLAPLITSRNGMAANVITIMIQKSSR